MGSKIQYFFITILNLRMHPAQFYIPLSLQSYHVMKTGIFSVFTLLITAFNFSQTVSSQTGSNLMDFDSLSDFSLTFNPWTVNDVGGGNTYGISNASFLHSGEPMAFICFNPSATAPPLTTMVPHSGKKLGACFSSVPNHNPNNKWLISPNVQIKPSEKIGFWVETYNKDYGLEQYNVGVSTAGNNPADFTIISGSPPQTAPDVWTYREYDLASYAGQNVYIGIQCVSDNQFIFMIDDIRIGYPLGIGGNSSDVEVIFYPNPAKDRLFINTRTAGTGWSVELINNLGTVIRTMIPGKNETIISVDLSGILPGIYFLRIVHDHKLFIEKVIIENQ